MTQSGLVRRYHLSADAPWVPLPRRHNGLVHEDGAGLAHLKHAGGRLLRRGAEQAIHRFGAPKIMNTDQGSQFTSFAWTDRLKRVGTRISPLAHETCAAGQRMDGKGRCLDNIFIERLWRSLKYECVYLHAWETGSQAKAGVAKWVAFYNHQRPHAAHGRQPPAMVYFTKIESDQQEQRVA